MADYDGLRPGEILADASVAEFIKTLGLGIAEAQKALDKNSVDQIGEFAAKKPEYGNRSLLEMGLSPAFYHYQHADITCSMQLSLRVEKDLSLGLNLSGSYEDTSSNSEKSTETTTETVTKTAGREANAEMTSSSMGTLTVNDQPFKLEGSYPIERLVNLRDAVTTNDTAKIARMLYDIEPSTLSISVDPAHSSVQTTNNTVAFKGGFGSAIIRIAENKAEDYKCNDDITFATTASTSTTEALTQYAISVKEQIHASPNYEAFLIGPGTPIIINFEKTGSSEVADSYTPMLMHLSELITAKGIKTKVEGFSDLQKWSNATNDTANDKYNKQLGDLRAKNIFNIIQSQIANKSLIEITKSRGDDAHQESNESNITNNINFRKVEIKFPELTNYLLLIVSQNNNGNFIDSVPDESSSGVNGNTNGFIHLFDSNNSLDFTTGNHVVKIDDLNFPLSGDMTAGQHATNLASAINNHPSDKLRASINGNVVYIVKATDKYKLFLFTSSSSNMTLKSTSGITITKQFTRSVTKQNTGNKTVAVGASLDVRYSRQFEMNVTGNSSISARLVSIPAPPQFLETIKEYLS